MDVYVHDRFYFLHPTTNFKVSVDLGQFLFPYVKIVANYYLRLTAFRMIFLGSTARVSINQEQVLVSGDCDSDQSNYDQCIDRSLYQVLKEEVNCTVPWVSNNNNICKVHHLSLFYAQ